MSDALDEPAAVHTGDDVGAGGPASLVDAVRARVVGGPGFSDADGWDFVEHADLPTALRWVLDQLDRWPSAAIAHLWHERVRWRVTLFRVRDKQLLLLDHEVDPAGVRAVQTLLPYRGYHQAALPTTFTPLAALRPHLAARAFNMLAREGFTTVEQVAAVPDLALMDIRHMGDPTIRAIRNAIAAVTAPTLPTTVQLNSDQIQELAALLSILSAWANGHGKSDTARRADAFLLGLSETDRAADDELRGRRRRRQ